MKMTKSLKLVGLGLAVALVVSVFFAFGCSEKEPTPVPVEPPPTPIEPTPAPVEPPPTPVEPTPAPVEPPPTPVDIDIYTDFNCSNCARLHFEVETELLQQYGKTGKAQFKIYLLPAQGPESVRAARAALCAAQQKRFWEYRHAILATWQQGGEAGYSEEELRKVASDLGLDEEAFGACLNSVATLDILEQNLKRSQAVGVDLVPTVFINGVKVVGIQPMETYVKIIEEQLTR